MNDDILNNFENLLDNLNNAIYNLKKYKKNIQDELKKWKCEVTINELNSSLYKILNLVKKWRKLYIETGDIYKINLNEYDIVSKETAYILGECSLIDEINIEAIDWQIGIVGNQIIKNIKERNDKDV